MSDCLSDYLIIFFSVLSCIFTCLTSQLPPRCLQEDIKLKPEHMSQPPLQWQGSSTGGVQLFIMKHSCRSSLAGRFSPSVGSYCVSVSFLQLSRTHKTHPLLFIRLSPVKPNPPERLAVAVMEDKSWPFLRVSWEPPHKADTRSGWITLIYEIRVKLEEEHEWEVRNLCRGMSWRLNVST